MSIKIYHFYKISITALLLSVFPIAVKAQVNASGIPFVNNYYPKDYKASEQNWDVLQDKRGIMYFGNSDNGVLEFDGIEWRQIQVTNSSIVRSLARDSSGRVYVGAVNEFGYLAPDKSGKMQYLSLSVQLDTSEMNFSHVWKAYGKENGAYFCTQDQIFDYTPGQPIKKIPLEKGSFLAYSVKGKLYISNYHKGIMVLNGNTVDTIPGSSKFTGRDIFGIVEYDESKLAIATIPGGIQLFNPKTGTISYPVEKERLEPFIAALEYDGVYNLLKTDDGNYVFSTLYNGVYLTDDRFKVLSHISTGGGLQYETVTSAYQNKEKKLCNPVWLSLYNGLSSIEFNSPLASFKANADVNTNVFDVVRYEGVLYVGTAKGLFYLTFDNDNPVFKKVPEIVGQVYGLARVDDGAGKDILIAATSFDIFKIEGGKAISYDIKLANIFAIHASRFHEQRIYLGLPQGAGLKVYEVGSKSIKQLDINKEVTQEIVSITEDNKENVWLSTSYDGLIRISSDNQIFRYDTTNGLPDNDNIKAAFMHNKLFICTKSGLYSFDELNERFFPDTSLHPRYGDGSVRVHNIMRDRLGNYWIICIKNNRYSVERLILGDAGKYTLDTISLRRLPGSYIEKCVHDPFGFIWIVGAEGLFSYNLRKEVETKRDFNALIRKVSLIRNDSAIFYGTFYESLSDEAGNITQITAFDQSGMEKPVLPYYYNSMTFHFAALWYISTESIEYSYYLEGYDDGWSRWTSEPKKDYTNLYEGKYTFRVKARNLYGVESSESSFSFEIRPPWYRTLWAYGGYLAILVFTVWLIIHLALRRMKKLNIAYGRYLPGSFLKLLEKRRVIDFKLGDMTERDMSIMFSDIRAYTNLSETMTPADNFRFQVRYLSQVGDMLSKNDGFAVQFYGDGVVAMFPGGSEDSAVQATIDMHNKVAEYSAERIKKGRRPLKIGIGMHTGPVVMGIRGDKRRWEGGIVGDSVNLAARMEGLTKMYGASTMISEEVYGRLKKPEKFNIRFLGKVKVKGKDLPVGIYEVIDGLPEEEFNLKYTTLKNFKRGLEFYFEGKMNEAQEEFLKVTEKNPEDIAAIHYVEVIKNIMVEGLPDDWDGVEKLDKK